MNALRFVTGLILAVEFCVAQQIVRPTLAHADVNYSQFLAAVRHDGITASDQILIANGDWVCDEVATYHHPLTTVERNLIGPNDFTPAQSHTFVNDALTYLCPLYPGGKPPTGAVAPTQPGTVV